MRLGQFFNQSQGPNIRRKHQPFFHSWLMLLERFFYSSGRRTRCAPHIRDSVSVQGLLNNFVIATIPCWLIGLWNLGYQSNLVMAEQGLSVLPGWRGGLLNLLGISHDPNHVLACLFHGLLYFIPIFMLALIVVSSWEVVFAMIRRRPLNEGLLAFAWLFTLIMPAGVDLYLVFLGVSFGYVFGSSIFGGYGRHIINPVLLGVVFLLIAYPDLVFIPSNWIPIPGANTTLPLELAITGGIGAVQSTGMTWWDLLLGIRPGPIGSVSALGCALGAAYLILTGSASWRIMLGALMGMMGAVILYSDLANASHPLAAIPFSWHLMLGAFAFGVIFFATDPVPAATTPAGRWVFGFLIGMLTTVIRVSNPSYNEGVLFAILLASLFSPLIDFCFIELNIRRRKHRLKVAQNE